MRSGSRCYNSPMHQFAKSRRVAAWIAALAIMLSALAPSISHALVAYAGGPADSVLVCTSAGYKWVNVSTGEQPNAPAETEKAGNHFERCAFCGTHADTFTLAPLDGITAPVIDAVHLAPSLFHHSPRPLFVWSASRSRAPPALS